MAYFISGSNLHEILFRDVNANTCKSRAKPPLKRQQQAQFYTPTKSTKKKSNFFGNIDWFDTLMSQINVQAK